MSRKLSLLIGRVRSVVDSIRSSYWFLPTMMAVAAGGAAIGLLALDPDSAAAIVRRIPWIAETDADGTRAVLSAIAGSMITVTGVVFSITIVALTLASSQFGPRLLRNFLRDRSNQFALGAFVATFLYSLIVLRGVRTDEVPHLASALAVALATVSIFVLIYFIHHTASSIQASSVIASVGREADAQLARVFPEGVGRGDDAGDRDDVTSALERLRADGADIGAPSTGFIRVIGGDALLNLARDHDLIIALRFRPGDFVAKGEAVFRAGPAAHIRDDVRDGLRDSVVLGEHRSAVQDILFLTGQLTEIAVRALSPGVNDPRTATECVQRLGAVMRSAARRRMPSGVRHDEDGRLRVLTPATTFEDIVGSCVDSIRRHGAGHVEVVTHVLDVLGRAGEGCDDVPRRRVLARHAADVTKAFEATGRGSAGDLESVDRALRQAMRRLGMDGRPAGGPPGEVRG